MAPPSKDELTTHLVDEITSGRLAAGAGLPPERELAQTFGLSRPTVREVLRGLQERGLVEIVPARGTFVRQPSTVDGARSMESLYRRGAVTAHDIMDARLMLETYAARLAAERATPGDVDAIERCAVECEAAAGVLDRAHLDITFHGLIAKASRNAVIETMFGSIAGFTFELMLRSHFDAHVAERGLPYHRSIVDALRAGDGDRAAEAMRAHLTIAADLYGPDYDRSIDSVVRSQFPGLGSPQPLERLLAEVGKRFGAGK
ncbi:FadR/GntR family transcriptional regulator [Actinomadura sp. 6N118]|uniref:FadR/GntR family transcriptional regulator n=1 Tax=Actinomadura sp. 6N118 TaxID=3375151 RepID=UPI0037BB0C98